MAKRTKSHENSRRSSEKTSNAGVAASSSSERDAVHDKWEISGDLGKTGRAGKTGGKAKDHQNERVAKLAQTLAARLSYASYKVSKGWIQQNINEIENLHSSRFSQQAENRKLQKGKGRAGHALEPYGKSGSIFAMDLDAGSTYSAHLPSGTPHTRSRYQGYTPVYGQDRAEVPSIYEAPVHPYAQEPQLAESAEISMGVPEKRIAETPPPTHPSPSMYNYLASPLNAAGPWQAGQHTGFTPRLGGTGFRPDSRTGGESDPAVVASGVPVPYTDLWQGPRSGTDQVVMPNLGARDPHSGLIMVDHALGTPGVASQSSGGFLSVQGNAQRIPASSPHSLLPPAGISSNRQGVRAMVQKHGRNPSNTGLRGEYSASNITLDDLDWHFQ